MGLLGVLGPPLRNSYRKKLGLYSYKIGKNYLHKKPGVVKLEVLNQIKRDNAEIGKAHYKIKEKIRESMYPLGVFTHKRFKIDPRRVPLLDIPDLNGFEVIST